MINKKGRKWYNNGIIEKCSFECPDGWEKGRLKKIGEAASKRMRENNPMYKLTEEQKKTRAEKIHLYNLNEFYFYELQQKNARLFILLQQAVKWFLDSPLTYDVVLHPKVRNTQKFALGSPHFLGRYLGKNLTNVGNKVIIYNS